jgi:hypothetical protein
MQDYKPNSHRFKEEQKAASTEEKKKVEKVVTGTVKTKKKSEISKLADVFITEDIGNVKSYIIWDVIVPATKNAISDIVRNGIDMLLFGGTGRSDKRSAAGYVSYRDYSKRKDDDRSDNSRTRTGYNYDDIVLESRGEAEAVLDSMQDLIETYGMVSVADMYDLVGKTCDYTDNKYGWTNIRNAEPIRVRDGYMLKLPKVVPLNIR